MNQNDQALQHAHDHPRAEISQSKRRGYYEVMETAVRELLVANRLHDL
jgi:hypothetical protein